MNLSVSLFLAQLLFEVGPWVEIGVTCKVVASIEHYTWLVAFCWMNILAFDVYRTFGRPNKVGMVSKANFCLYMLYGWFVPLVIVGICLLLHLATGLNFQYEHDNTCWITGYSLLYGFVVPLGLIILVNIVFFICTLVGLAQTMKETQRANESRSEKERLVLYVKLSSLMGFTWVFGFLANIHVLWFLRYLFIACNTLQGVFICMSFVLTSKVHKMYKERLCGEGPQRSGMSTSSTSVPHVTSSESK